MKRKQTRLARLRAALDAATDIGIYPQSVSGGKNAYKKRTEFMNGWNAAQAATLKAIIEQLSKNDWT